MPLIDMHIHLSGRSSCSILSEQQLYNNLSPRLDGICITDHWVLKPLKHMSFYGFQVYFGVELRCNLGDILAYGLKRLPSRDLNAHRMIRFIHEQNAVAVCAHPFSTRHAAFGERVYDFNFDAIELNGAIGKNANQQAMVASKIMAIPTIGGSDSHSKDQLNTIATQFEAPISSLANIKNAIKNGKCKAVHI
ncbi:MAG: PHP domain-containing protein [Promethearchaeia archaeon]